MQTTLNTSSLIRQELYSRVLLATLDEFLIEQTLFRDYTEEFPDGDNLNISQIGDILWSDYAENTPIDFSAIDTSRINLQLSEYKGDAFYITDKFKQDSHQAGPMFIQRIKASGERLKSDMQSSLFMAANSAQTLADPNLINNQPHRFAVNTTTPDILGDLAKMKLAFDKARVPHDGRILIVDATVEFELNTLTNNVINVENPQFRGIVETGFAKNYRFIRNIYGFDIWVSDLLPRIASETLDDKNGASQAITNGIANLAMYVGDADATAMMGVMRGTPSPAFERNEHLKRDEWSTTARWGFGLQRPQCLGVYLTNF